MVDVVVPVLVPLEVASPRPAPVYPPASSGYATGLLGGFFGLGIIVFALIVLGRRPPTQRDD